MPVCINYCMCLRVVPAPVIGQLAMNHETGFPHFLTNDFYSRLRLTENNHCIEIAFKKKKTRDAHNYV